MGGARPVPAQMRRDRRDGIQVQLVRATNLQAPSHGTMCDPYVVLELNGQKWQSSVQSNTQNPKWMRGVPLQH